MDLKGGGPYFLLLPAYFGQQRWSHKGTISKPNHRASNEKGHPKSDRSGSHEITELSISDDIDREHDHTVVAAGRHHMHFFLDDAGHCPHKDVC